MYQQFAQVYDDLMLEDIDYEKWVEYIEGIFTSLRSMPQTIIDLACGTGNITIPLAQKGYDMVGIDISQDMLTIAEQKARKGLVKVQWLCQDIKNLQGFGNKDGVICACDGMNYILNNEDLRDIFSRVYHSLKEEGIFTFDMNSKYKIEEILAEQTFAYSGEDVSYIWENFYDEQQHIIDFELSFFVKDGGNYKRFDEIHQQKAYSIEEIINLLKKVGFTYVEYYEAFTFHKPSSNSERIQYVAKK